MPRALVSTLALLSLTLAAAAQRGVPIPLEKDLVNRDDGVTWIVEGRQRIPSHVTLSSLRACRIQGAGADAVLEVEGELDLRAATGGTIDVEGVWIEPVAGCKGLTLLNLRFQGSGGLRTAEGAVVETDIMLQSSAFEGDARCDMGLFGGELVLMSVGSQAPLVVRGLTDDKQKRNALELVVDSCKAPARDLTGGLVVEGVKQVRVSNSELGGQESRLVDCGKVEFVANLVRSRRMEFRYSTPKSFKGVRIDAVDFACGELVLRQPTSGSDPEKVRLSDCWFDDRPTQEEVRQHMLRDASSDPENGALGNLVDLHAAPLGLGGKVR